MNNRNDEKDRQLTEDMERMDAGKTSCASNNMDETYKSHALTEDQLWHMIHDPIKLELYPIFKPYEPEIQIIPKFLSFQPVLPNQLFNNAFYVNDRLGSIYNNAAYSADGITWVAHGGLGNQITVPLQ